MVLHATIKQSHQHTLVISQWCENEALFPGTIVERKPCYWLLLYAFLHTHEIGMTGPRSQVTTCLSIKLSCTCTSTIHLLKMYISINAVQGYTIIPISKGMQVTSTLIPSITTITIFSCLSWTSAEKLRQ